MLDPTVAARPQPAPRPRAAAVDAQHAGAAGLVQRTQSDEAADEVASFPPLHDWTVDQVVTFICHVNSQFVTLYEETFRKEKILGSYLVVSTKDDLIDDLGIKKLHAGQCNCSHVHRSPRCVVRCNLDHLLGTRVVEYTRTI